MNDRIMKILKRIRPDDDFSVSNDFVKDGLLDSFDMVELMQSLEREFDIVIDDTMIETDTFSSIEGIAGLLKLSGAEAE